LCGPAPCDGGTTTLIKEAAGCLFDLKNETATVEAVAKNKREQRKT